MTPHPARYAARIRAHYAAPFNFILQVLEDAGNRHDHRYPILANKLHDLAGMHLAGERRRAFEKKRNEQSLRLAEHMAERQQIENSNRLKWPRPFFVFGDLAAKRPEVRANIPVPVHHTFRLAGCSGCVNDFDDIARSDFARGESHRGRERRDGIKAGVVDDELGLRFPGNTLHKVGRESIVHRNCLNAARHRGPEHRHPFQTILSPD